MTMNFAQDWPVYVLLGATAVFFIYVVIKGNQGNKEKKDTRAADKDNKQN